MPVAQRVAHSQSVFIGQVVTHAPLNSITLTRIEVFKGRVSRRVTIPTAQSDCDFFLPPVQSRPGERFLVFLTVHGASVSANRCLGSKPMAEAGHDLVYSRRTYSK
jgi:hypothetical protein